MKDNNIFRNNNKWYRKYYEWYFKFSYATNFWKLEQIEKL